jgi:hypothetical protein
MEQRRGSDWRVNDEVGKSLQGKWSVVRDQWFRANQIIPATCLVSSFAVLVFTR